MRATNERNHGPIISSLTSDLILIGSLIYLRGELRNGRSILHSFTPSTYVKIIDISSLIARENGGKQLDKALFVYPTDSIYGLGSVATAENVAKIDAIKGRQPNKHYSIIVPGFSWLYEHFDVQKSVDIQRQGRYAEHGPLTVLCRRREPSFLSRVSSNEFVGIRIINHPFQEFVTLLGQPFLSTSANASGQPYDPERLPKLFAGVADYFITNEAPMTQTPSTLLQYPTGDLVLRK